MERIDRSTTQNSKGDEGLRTQNFDIHQDLEKSLHFIKEKINILEINIPDYHEYEVRFEATKKTLKGIAGKEKENKEGKAQNPKGDEGLRTQNFDIHQYLEKSLHFIKEKINIPEINIPDYHEYEVRFEATKKTLKGIAGKEKENKEGKAQNPKGDEGLRTQNFDIHQDLEKSLHFIKEKINIPEINIPDYHEYEVRFEATKKTLKGIAGKEKENKEGEKQFKIALFFVSVLGIVFYSKMHKYFHS